MTLELSLRKGYNSAGDTRRTRLLGVNQHFGTLGYEHMLLTQYRRFLMRKPIKTLNLMKIH